MTRPFDFDAGHLAVDFINTVRLLNGERTDLLQDFHDLKRWLAEARLADPAALEGLTGNEAEVFREAVHLRNHLRQTLEGLIAGEGVPADFVQHINFLLKTHPAFVQLRGDSPPFHQETHHPLQDTADVLGVLAAQVADLFTWDLQGRLKKCENHRCIRHFLDTSKNKTRRWCSMQGCGNRAKAQAFYGRKKSKNIESKNIDQEE